MSLVKAIKENSGLRLTVVRKIVIGFVSLTLILLITSSLSFFGLKEIEQSADVVANEKMPIQQTVASAQSAILNLSVITTNAYFETDKIKLEQLRDKYDLLSKSFKDSIAILDGLVIRSDSVQNIAILSDNFLTFGNTLFDTKLRLINTNVTLKEKASQSLSRTDEASALMLDLTYLESDSNDLDALVGMSTNIDNKLGLILSNIDSLVRESDNETVNGIMETLEYSISNIQVDADYAKQIAQNIDDQGIFDMFDTEYLAVKESLLGDAGMFTLKTSMLELSSQLDVVKAQTNISMDNAIDLLNAMSDKANAEAVAGQESILQTVQNNMLKSLIASILGTLATITLAIVATRSIAKPLKYINFKLNQLSNGDLTQKLKISSDDEFSDLSKNVNNLINSLRSLIGSIHSKEEELRQVTLSSIEMGDKSLQQVAQQESQIDSTSENTQLVKKTSMTNMQQISEADAKIDEAISQSERVVELVEQSSSQINEQSVQAQRSAEIVNRLGENSHKIGNILDVIKTIAEQTNLLALNAAIEAARAGEQGRGFAVVADEVRTLATRTHDSTEEIEKMIINLQTDSSSAVNAMNQGASQVEKGVDLIEQVSSEVDQIKTIIQSIAEVNRNIVSDTQSQDNLLDNVVISLETIVLLSKDAASSTQASNEAIHGIASQMNELRQACEKFKLA